MDGKVSKISANGGVGFFGLLQVAFIVLKLTNVIDWSWWVVLIPAFIQIAVILMLLVIAVIIIVKGE